MRDSKNGDLLFLRTVAPKEPVSGGRVILSVGFKNFLTGHKRMRDLMISMRIEGGVAGIVLQKSYGLFDLFDQTFVSGILFKAF